MVPVEDCTELYAFFGWGKKFSEFPDDVEISSSVIVSSLVESRCLNGFETHREFFDVCGETKGHFDALSEVTISSVSYDDTRY